MDIKRDVKTTMTAKNCLVENGKIMDEDGEILVVEEIAQTLFGTGTFKMTLTTSSSEEIEL